MQVVEDTERSCKPQPETGRDLVQLLVERGVEPECKRWLA